MNSAFSKEKLLSDFKEQSAPVFDQAIRYILDTQKKDVDTLLSSLAPAGNGFPDEAIRNLVSIREAQHTRFAEVWIDAVEEATSTLPELINLPQEEIHYSTQEGDSVDVILVKILKRSKRGLRKGALATENGFLRAFKKEEKQFEISSREVPFRCLVKQLILEMRPQIIKWHREEFRFIAQVLNEAQDWSLRSVSNGEEEPEEFGQLIQNWKDRSDKNYKEQTEELTRSHSELETKVQKVLEVVGTYGHKADRYSDERVDSLKAKFNEGLQKLADEWADLIEALSERTLISLELMDLKEEMLGSGSSVISRIDTYLEDQVYSHHLELKKNIEESIKALEGQEFKSFSKLEHFCDDIQVHTRACITDQINTALTQSVEERSLSALFEEYTEQLGAFTVIKAEKVKLIEDLDIEKEKPEYDIKEVDWVNLVKRMTTEYMVAELIPEKVEPESMLEDFIEQYNEILQIIETNLDVVDEATDNDEEAPETVALEGLKRTIVKIDEVQELLGTRRNELKSRIFDQTSEFLSKVTDILIKQDHGEMRWVNTQLKVKESAGGWKTRGTVLWAKFIDRFDLIYRFSVRKYKHYLEQTQKFLGLQKTVSIATRKTNLATFLYETDQQFEKLPFIYRRLFDFHRDIENAFFIKDIANFETCRKAFELWNNNFPSTVAILGEKGSGKSTLIRFLHEEVFNEIPSESISFTNTRQKKEDLVESVSEKLGLKKVSTSEELIAALKKHKKGSAVSVENIQNCYLRNIHGYEAIKTLIYIISETRNEIFWVVSCSRYAWNFLNVVFKVNEYFSHSILTDDLNEKDIESLIMKRQKASGYHLWFQADSSTQKSRSYRKLLDDEEAAQAYLREQYFEKLSRMAEGNATVAMIFWIRSIGEFDDNYFSIQPFDFTETEYLDGLDPVSTFALSAFILHDALTSGELASVLNISVEEADMVILRLNARGILVPLGKYYTLNDLIYRQVVRLLKTKNILH